MSTRREWLQWAGGSAALVALRATGGLTLAAAASHAAAAGIPARAGAIDPMNLVDPQLREPLQAMLRQGSAFEMNQEALPRLRERMRSFTRPALDAPSVTEQIIPGPKDAPNLKVLVVGASPGQSKPAVLHVHGGGYVLGSAAMSIRPAQDLSLACECVVVTVEYRLAPETPFPGALEDSYAALRWLHAQAETLGVDRSRIAVMGESAGGGLAAMLAIAARNRGEVPLCFQTLIYPMLDDRTGSSRPVPPHIGTYVWTAAQNRFGWGALLGQPAGRSRVPAGSVPARERDLARLPPTFIGTGSLDLFVEEDIEYARRLLAAGVSTELLVAPGAFHGFDAIVPAAALSQQFTRQWRLALRRAFALAAN